MDKQEEMRQWIAIADRDLLAARHMAQTMRPVQDEIICFHCQQCAEKYLKWVIVFYDIDPPKVHDLEHIGKLCETIEPRFSELYDKCVVLTRYGVLPKYPNEMQIDTEDTKRAISYAQTVRDFVRNQFPEYFSGNENDSEKGTHHA
jgi:HEPN domain-containing protein